MFYTRKEQTLRVGYWCELFIYFKIVILDSRSHSSHEWNWCAFRFWLSVAGALSVIVTP